MNSILKNALMVSLLVSAGSVVCNVAEDQLFDSYAAVKAPCVSSENRIFGGQHEAPMGPQGYWPQMMQALTFALNAAKTMSAQTAAYLAEMPKSVDGASLGGYATADNAKNVLAKAGVAAVGIAAAYGMYKVAFKQTKKEVNCAPVRFV